MVKSVGMKKRAIKCFNHESHWLVRFGSIIRFSTTHTRVEEWAKRQDINVRVGWQDVRVDTQQDALLLYLAFS